MFYVDLSILTWSSCKCFVWCQCQWTKPADINFVYDSFCLATDAMEFTACWTCKRTDCIILTLGARPETLFCPRNAVAHWACSFSGIIPGYLNISCVICTSFQASQFCFMCTPLRISRRTILTVVFNGARGFVLSKDDVAQVTHAIRLKCITYTWS